MPYDQSFAETVRAENEDAFAVADATLHLLKRVATGSATYGSGKKLITWQFFNVGAIAAGYRLVRGNILLCEAGLSHEATALARPLLELVANMAYMEADVESRPTDFLHQAVAAKKRILGHLGAYNLGDSSDQSAIAEAIEKEQRELTEYLGGPSPGIYEAIRPFNKSAKQRMEAAGLHWHYDLFFGTASDHIHMSARAIEMLTAWVDDDGGRIEVRTQELSVSGVLTICSEMGLRLLYLADRALSLGIEDEVSKVTKEYWLVNRKKNLLLETLIAHFKGEEPPPQAED